MIFVFIIVLLLFIYIGFINYRDTHKFVFTEYTVENPKLDKEILVAVLADLHSQSYGPENQRLINAVLAKRPYVVLGCGDLYTSSKGGSTEPAINLLKGISKHIPVIMSEGNHESKTRINPVYFNGRYEDYVKQLEEISNEGKGITFAVNETVFLDGPSISISGFSLENRYFRHFRHEPLPEGYMEERLPKIPEDTFRILLAHNPLYFDDYVKWGADLVLSGHLHGGVIRLPGIGGLLSPEYTMFPKVSGGSYKKGNTTMIVSQGLGTHTIPIRLWNPPEVVLIRLKPANEV